MTKTIAITSGKGGVGKTSILANIAVGLAERGRRVLILDGDLGMANVDLFFGVKPEYCLIDVLKGQRTLNEILTVAAPGVTLIPGGSGITEYNNLNAFERRSILDAIQSLENQYDYLLIDTAPGLSENVLQLNSAAQMSGVIITPDPSSFADAYSLIKVLNHRYHENHFSIISNMVRDEVEGFSLYQRFSDVVSRFLNVGLDYWGTVPDSAQMKRTQLNQRLVLRHDSNSLTGKHLNQIVMRIEGSMTRQQSKNGLQFFWDQVVGVA